MSDSTLEKVIKTIDSNLAASYISAGGALSKTSKNFEERKSQIDLLKCISETFNKGALGVYEAGTGVGKSYAYLIPSIIWALENKTRVIVSTGTINLQSQLCEKDIPAVEKILGRKIHYLLMKGRQNYICLRRLQDITLMPDLFEEDNETIQQISDWAKESKTGSKTDLPFNISESVWTKVNSESDACMGGKCPFFEQCFVMKIRKEAMDAQLIVVNHHLLFADIQARMNGAGYENQVVLPPYQHIVFDEAHGIEAAATSFFSESINRFKLNKTINQLYRRRKNSESGHLLNLAIISSNEEKASELYDITNQVKSDLNNLEVAASDLLQYEYSLRLCEHTKRNFGPVLNYISQLYLSLGKFSNIITSLMEGVSEDDRDTPSYWETKMLSRNIEGFLMVLRDFSVWEEHQNQVFWIQKRMLPPDIAKDGTPWFITFTSTPLDIAPMMNEGVFEPMTSIVFTSATLRTGNSFRYWMGRTGVAFSDTERIVSQAFESPFDYKNNLLFAVPRDAPFWNDMAYQPYIELAVTKLIKAAQGRTLVLFTSYDSLRSAYNNVKSSLRGFNGNILRQGELDNAKLLEKFKNETESVLFATDSFWQGVDVPGESLSQVIIVKLPFTVPNDPVFTAKSEAIEKRGGNSFMDLSVPEAVTKFRQGVGRLIRRGDDRGAVVVLDKRIYEKRYGTIFAASVPECRRIYDTLEHIEASVKNFLDV